MCRSLEPCLAAAALVLAACSAGSATPNKAKPHDAGHAVDAGESEDSSAGGAMTGYCPPNAPNEDSLVVGLSASGDVITGKFLKASPNPPEQYDNRWLVEFDDADGNPIEDVEVLSAGVHMPFHKHRDIDAEISAVSTQPAQVNAKLYFRMSGYFEITFKLHSATLDVSDAVMFGYCLR